MTNARATDLLFIISGARPATAAATIRNVQRKRIFFIFCACVIIHSVSCFFFFYVLLFTPNGYSPARYYLRGPTRIAYIPVSDGRPRTLALSRGWRGAQRSGPRKSEPPSRPTKRSDANTTTPRPINGGATTQTCSHTMLRLRIGNNV